MRCFVQGQGHARVTQRNAEQSVGGVLGASRANLAPGRTALWHAFQSRTRDVETSIWDAFRGLCIV